MTTTKAAGVVFILKLLRAKGPEAEKAFFAKLNPDQTKAVSTAMPVTRLDLDQVALCYDLAATILFPLDTEGVWKIGYAMAKDNFNGLYKFLISIATVPFLVKQVPTIWNIYYDKGNPRAELPPEGGIGTIVVENLPELPMSIRVLTTGFIQSALEFTKVKNIKVKLTSTNPQAWKWVATWEH